MSYSIQRYQCPVGNLYLVGRGATLCGIIYEQMWPRFAAQFAPSHVTEAVVLKEVRRQLDEYFAGKRQSFSIAFELQGTPFQRKVWLALQQIPFGETRTYKEQARHIQSPGAARAIGRADGLNPISIILPCHRVIGTNGALTGYGGGLEVKQFLLDLEATPHVP